MKNNSINIIYILLFISNSIFANFISVSENPAEKKILKQDWNFNDQFSRIIDPPQTTIGFYSDIEAMVGFNEKQNIKLLDPLEIDGNKFIYPGEVVSSHIIFLTIAKEDNTLLKHKDVQWEFDSEILGVMSNEHGRLLFQSSPILGAEETIYHPPGTEIKLYGMEGIDNYSFNENLLTLSLTTAWHGPGDWIRVITLGDNNTVPVPEPSTLFLILFCIPLIVFIKKNK